MDARTRIAGLGQPGERADFQVAETQGAQPADRRPIFVIAGGQTNRVLEAQPERLHFQTRVVDLEQAAQQPPRDREAPGGAQRVKRQAVSALGVELEQQGANERVHR